MYRWITGVCPVYFCSINVKYALYVLLDTWSLPQYISVSINVKVCSLCIVGYLEFAPVYFCSINVKYALYVSLDTWSLPQYISVVSMLSMLYMYRWLPGVCPSIFL